MKCSRPLLTYRDTETNHCQSVLPDGAVSGRRWKIGMLMLEWMDLDEPDADSSCRVNKAAEETI